MWQVASQNNSSPGCVWAFTAIWFDIVPEGTYSAASLPKYAATLSCNSWTVGSSLKTSSPTSAAAINARIAGVGLVTVSLRKSIGASFIGGFSVVIAGPQPSLRGCGVDQYGSLLRRLGPVFVIQEP